MTDIFVGYACLKVALESGKIIKDTIGEVVLTGRLLAPHELHMTLMYDGSNPVRSRNLSVVSDPDSVYNGVISGYSLLGEETSAFRAVVLEVECPDVVARHEELSIFMTHSFDNFIPHISVAYGVTPEDLLTLQSRLTKLVGTPIILYGENFSTVKE